ncbi:MAG: glycosyltransferase family 4 protein [Fermentimonas sp.]|jgi:glycosyltransferase involved in cell wall biosynthesis|nr:glycosyltransferase family 4 protein [Fermentimonas sp.]TAH60780.1 MAG: glycosyltransferase [Fermentimonas caenicola]
MSNINEIGKKKLLIFHPVLATYRIDQFNILNEIFDLEVVLLFDQMWNFNIDQNKISEQCHFKYSYLLSGPRYKGRLFRFGMYKKIRQVDPDIILGYEYSFTTQYLLLLKKLGLVKQKVGTFVDDSLDICINIQSKIRKIARDKSLKILDFLVVMSKEVADFHHCNFNLKENSLIISPILQLPERLRKNSDTIEKIAQNHISKYNLKGKKVLLFVGRFIPEKALDIFLKKVSQFIKDKDDCLFLLIGEGSELEKIKSIVEDEKIDNKVLFPGKYQFDELYAWYASSSGFVLPSLSETFGAVVNEALVFGLSVFCSKYAGASSLIDSNNGITFNPLDEEDTLKNLELFYNQIKPVNEVNISERPPLISSFRERMISEWGKLAYE